MENNSGRHSIFRLVLALVFVFCGVIALGNNLHWWDIDDLFFEWWPLIVILIGLVTLFSPGGSWGGGIFLIFLGVLFLLHTHGIYDIEDLVWPAVLIMVGVIVWPRKRKFPNGSNSAKNQNNKQGSFYTTSSNHIFNINTIFNSRKEIINDDQLKGGHATAAFGNLEIDLSQATPGLDTYLEFSAIFGNITLIVPSDWKIIKHGGPVFGKVNDKRTNVSNSQQIHSITIEMNAIFGHINIVN